MSFRLLPWDYGIRNLFRRPLRSGLTLAALTTVTLLVFIVLGFVRGLEQVLTISGDPRTLFVFSLGMGENLEYSSVPMRTADLVAASVPGIQQRYGKKYVSPELYSGTQVRISKEGAAEFGLVRGVTPAALLVHNRVEIQTGDWPNLGEVLVGKQTAAKLGVPAGALTVGKQLWFEGRSWRISGTFAASGGTAESELWCRLDDLQQAMQRQDLSLVVLRMAADGQFQDFALFCKERLDLELQALRQTDYFAALRRDYAPVRWLSWLVVLLVAGAGVFVGLNTMYGSVVGRIREVAVLQTIGFSRRAAIVSVVQEGTLLAMTAALLASFAALVLFHGVAVRFTMGAFELRIDSVTLLWGNLVALALGTLGALPPAVRLFRQSVVEGLRSV